MRVDVKMWRQGRRGRGRNQGLWPGQGPFSHLPPWQRPGWLYGPGSCWHLYRQGIGTSPDPDNPNVPVFPGLNFCQKCSTPLLPNAKYCAECGAKIDIFAEQEGK